MIANNMFKKYLKNYYLNDSILLNHSECDILETENTFNMNTESPTIHVKNVVDNKKTTKDKPAGKIFHNFIYVLLS